MRTLIIRLFLLLGLFFPALAAAVTPNTAPTFLVGDGIVTIAIGSSSLRSVVAVHADGKILVAGTSDSKFALARYNSDGSLDTSFGSGGIVTTAIGTYSYGYSVVVQADGKILLAGVSDFNFALARYNSDGSLDASFGTDGIVTTAIAIGTYAYGYSVAMQADGKILVAGISGSNFALARYTTDGSLDTSFGSGGIVTTAIGTDAYGYSVVVQADGKILLAGVSDEKFALARYNTNGSLDTSFGSGGIVTTAIGTYSYGYSVVVQADGKILLAGISGSNFALARYTSDGSLDASFGSGGIVTTAIGSDANGYSVAVQADGKILVAGSSDNKFALARYNTDGSLDTSFGSGGMVTTAIGYSAYGYSVAVQADGKILLAGTSDSNFALARYTSDGSLDTSFTTLDTTPSFAEGGAAVILDSTVSIYDAELSPSHYSGATVTLARQGGASPDDVFSNYGYWNPVLGTVLGTLTEGAVLSLSGTIIGTVTQNSGGTLALLFNSNATQARVDQTLSSIAYANTSNAPSASVVIDWTFNDGNSGAQGSGGALSTTGSTTVMLIATNDAPTASNATITLAANSTYTLQAGDFGFLDAEDGTALTAVRIDSLPAAGSLRYGGALMVAGLDVSAAELAAGYLTFTSASTASGANYASFQFRVKDSGGAYASSANTLSFGIGCMTPALSATSVSANAAGLTGNISVTAATGCAWTATSNASWITITSGSSGSGNGYVVYAVAANTGSSARTGTLTIAGQTFTVTQQKRRRPVR